MPPTDSLRTAGLVPYGLWESPITASALSTGVLSFEDIICDDGAAFWVELRPDEHGRSVLMMLADEAPVAELAPPSVSVRSGVHEYGGAAIALGRGREIFYVDAKDQRVYHLSGGCSPHPLTPRAELRFADMTFDPTRRRLIAICEDHRGTRVEPENFIAAIAIDGSGLATVVRGNDFYQAPRISPDGSTLAWITWNHPNLPWDDTELWVAQLDVHGDIASPLRVAGGTDEAVSHPSWSPDGVLHFLSDRSGWWNLYRWLEGEIETLCPDDADFGRPTYSLGGVPYCWLDDGSIVSVRSDRGITGLVRIDPDTRGWASLDTDCTLVSSPRHSNGAVYFLGGSATEPVSVRKLHLASREVTVVRAATSVKFPSGLLAEPEVIEFPTKDGSTSHGFYYPPRNPAFRGAAEERPPLLVFVHGGPIGATTTALTLGPRAILAPAYWTSRGFAVLDVNYRGSTGYGRSYQRHIYGRWGDVDVDDCIAGASFLIARGVADPDRIIIRGASAGGATTMTAVTRRKFFAAGGVYFGVSDLEAFHRETHKFESHHDHRLIGSWKDERARYRELSSVNHVRGATTPCILFQGTEDQIVPPNQSERFVEGLREAGVPVSYLTFDGEGHGFRAANTIEMALEAELAFYKLVFGLVSREEVAWLDVCNL